MCTKSSWMEILWLNSPVARSFLEWRWTKWLKWVYLDWIICKTHILGKIISLCFKIRSVYVYIPSFCSYGILTNAFVWELKLCCSHMWNMIKTCMFLRWLYWLFHKCQCCETMGDECNIQSRFMFLFSKASQLRHPEVQASRSKPIKNKERWSSCSEDLRNHIH